MQKLILLEQQLLKETACGLKNSKEYHRLRKAIFREKKKIVILRENRKTGLDEEIIAKKEVLEHKLKVLKEELKKNNLPCKKDKEYHRLQEGISRLNKKIKNSFHPDPAEGVILNKEKLSLSLIKKNKKKSTELENLFSADLLGEATGKIQNQGNLPVVDKKKVVLSENLPDKNFDTNPKEQAFPDFWLETGESKREKMSKQAMLGGKKQIFKISPFANDNSVEEAKIPYLNRVLDKFAGGAASSLICQNKAIATFLNCDVDDFSAVNVYNSELLNDMMTFHYDFRKFEKDEQHDDDYVSYEEPYVPYRRHPVMIAFQNHRFKLYSNSVLFPEKIEKYRYPLMVIRHKIYLLKRIFVEISRQFELLFCSPGTHAVKRHFNPNKPPLVLRPVINTASDAELDKVYEEYWKNYKEPSPTREELVEIDQTRKDDLCFDDLRKRDRTLQTVYEVERIKGSDKFFL